MGCQHGEQRRQPLLMRSSIFEACRDNDVDAALRILALQDIEHDADRFRRS